VTYDPNHDPTSPYGYDAFVLTDIMPDGRSCSGPMLVQNALVHRLMADTLPLTGAPGGVAQYGKDVRAWVGEATTQDSANAKGPELVAVLNRDDRLDPSQTKVQVVASPSTTFTGGSAYDLAIAISAVLTDGTPLAVIVGVNKWTVQAIASQGGT
jgi:hypothetical protein